MKDRFTLLIIALLALGAGNTGSAQNIHLIKDTAIAYPNAFNSSLTPLSNGRFGSHYIKMEADTERFYLDEVYPIKRSLCSFPISSTYPTQMARHGNTQAVIVINPDMNWGQVRIRLIHDSTGAFQSDTLIILPEEYISFMLHNTIFLGDTLVASGLTLKGNKLVPLIMRHTSQSTTFTSYDSITANGFWLLSAHGDEMTCLVSRFTPPSSMVYSFKKYKGSDTVWTYDMDTTFAGFRGVHQMPGALLIDAVNADSKWVNYSISPTGDIKLVDHPHFSQFTPSRFSPFETTGILWVSGADSAGNMVLFGMTALGDSIFSKTFPIHPASNGLILSENDQGGIVGLRSTQDTITWEPKLGFSHFAFLPSAPELTIIGTTNALSVGWNVPKNGGSPIQSYEIRYRKPAENWTVSPPIPVTHISYTINDLESNQLYQVQIRATNIAGAGSWSDTVSAETLNSTGLLEYAGSKINVFPNPVKAGGRIHSPSLFEIYDLLGNKLPASDIAPNIPGIYIIHVIQSGKERYQKLLVE